MILVIGANGTVGSAVVDQVVKTGSKVRVLVRDAARAETHGPDVEVFVGDLTNPSTLAPAFAGARSLFIVTRGPAELENHAIDAARAAGVRHIVKLSSMGFGPIRDALAIGNWHREVEAHLEASGIAWTVLLAGGFSTNALGWAPMIKAQGAVFAPTGEGKVAVVDPRDLAAVATKALTQPGHEGKRYELTGVEPLSFAEQAALIGEAIGKPIRFVDVPPSAARDAMANTGMPAPMIDGLLEVMAKIKAGVAAIVSPDLERILGRKPTTFATWARDYAAAFI